MANIKIFFTDQNCKGCELCVEACPKGLIRLGERINNLGYHVAGVTDGEKCTGCGFCAIMCPDMVIVVEREVQG